MNSATSPRHLFEPETLLPAQYFDRLAAEPSLQPEKRLMLAVLESAVAAYQRYALATSRRGRRLFAESEEWLEEAHDGWVFSFENICSALRFDAEFLRRGLRQWRARELARAPASGRRQRAPFRRVNGLRHSVSGRPAGRRARRARFGPGVSTARGGPVYTARDSDDLAGPRRFR